MHSFATRYCLSLFLLVLQFLVHIPILCEAADVQVNHHEHGVRGIKGPRHNSFVERQRSNAATSYLLRNSGTAVNISDSTLAPIAERAESAVFTRYRAGLGACGGHNTDSDFVVALNIPQWDGGSHCYDTVTVSYGGKTTQAQIVDECMKCPYNGLDLSNGLFAFFADPSLGTLSGSWTFGSVPGLSSKNPMPTTSPSVPHTTTTATASTETKSSEAPATTKLSSKPATSASSTGNPTSATTTTAAAVTTTTAPATAPQLFSQINMLMLNLGGLAVGAAVASK